MEKFRIWLKRQTDVLVAVGVLCGMVSALGMSFGGHPTPWVGWGQAMADEAVLSKAIDTLSKLNDKIDLSTRRLNSLECQGLQTRLIQAKAAMEKIPTDPIASTLYYSTLDQMRRIEGCVPAN